MHPWPWNVLGTEPGSDERAVRRAYARVLKLRRADENAEEFQALRVAYEHALTLARDGGTEGGAMKVLVTEGPDRERHHGCIEGGGLQAETPPDDGGIETYDRPEPLLPPSTLDAADEAERIWGTFAAQPANVTSRRAITELFASVVNIALRGELEWQALLYCSRDDIPEGCRSDIAAVLNWREGSGHLLQRNVVVARQALAKVFADDEMVELRQRFSWSVDVLSRSHPGRAKALWWLRDGARHREMQALLFSLRTAFANARVLRFDNVQITFWECACTYRTQWGRLCTMVPLLGVWSGVLLAQGISHLRPDRDNSGWSGRGWTVIAAVAFVTLLVYAVAAFGPPSLASRWKRIARENAGVRYGWIALWIAGTCAAYADERGGVVLAAGLAALSVASAWAIAVHGWPILKGLLILTTATASGFGFYGYFVRVAGGPWQVPIAQGALYTMFISFVRDELRSIIVQWKWVHRATVVVWLVACATTAAVFLAPTLADAGADLAGSGWAAYAFLVAVAGMLGKMRWVRMFEITRTAAGRLVLLAWFSMAWVRPSFAAFVALCLMGVWIVRDLQHGEHPPSG